VINGSATRDYARMVCAEQRGMLVGREGGRGFEAGWEWEAGWRPLLVAEASGCGRTTCRRVTLCSTTRSAHDGMPPPSGRPACRPTVFVPSDPQSSRGRMDGQRTAQRRAARAKLTAASASIFEMLGTP
jgi:hypothetical protein